MGFFGSIFGKKKVEESAEVVQKMEKTTLELPALLGWIDSNFGKDMESESKRFSELSKDLLDYVDDFQKNIYNIRNKKFEEGDRTYAAINMIKDTWARKALMSISSYHKDINDKAASSGTLNFPDFRKIFHGTIKLMNETNMIPKQKIVLQKYFEGESKKMAGILKSIGEKTEEIRLAINEKSRLKAFSEVEKMIGDMETLKSEIESIEKSMKELDAHLKEKNKERSDALEDLDSVERSPEWDNLQHLGKELERCARKKEDIENSVTAKLGEFKRVMKLFAHDSRTLSKEEKRLAENLSHSPLKAYLSADAVQLQELFKKLMMCIETGDFILSAKDKGKLGSIKQIVNSGWLGMSRSEYEDTKDQCASYEEKMGKITVKIHKKEAERAAEKTKLDVKQLKHEIEVLEGKVRSRKQELKSKKNDISALVMKELGAEVELL